MVTEIIQDVAIILLACTCIVQTIRYRRLGTAVNNWVPQMRTYTIDLGNDSRIVMNVGPTAPSERAIYGVHDGFVSIPLSAFYSTGQEDSLAQMMIRKLEALVQKYGPYSLELLSSEELLYRSRPDLQR